MLNDQQKINLSSIFTYQIFYIFYNFNEVKYPIDFSKKQMIEILVQEIKS